MEEDVEVLDAARVTDVGNPIIIRKDTIEYTFTNIKTGEVLVFSNRHKILKHFGKVCIKYLGQLVSGVRTPATGMWVDWYITRRPLKPQRLSVSTEYVQADGSGEDLTATNK